MEHTGKLVLYLISNPLLTTMNIEKLHKVKDWLWEIPPSGRMRVPARIYATESMLAQILQDNASEQAANVAELPGIVRASYAMPDIHSGYGFPIGGVAAFDINEGIVSPGGVGYDINCGVRLMVSELDVRDVVGRISHLVDRLFSAIPCGVGGGGSVVLKKSELQKVVSMGARWAIEHGYGVPEDTEFIEESGCMDGNTPENVSERAYQRGADQLGTLGSGNHFLEVGFVTAVFDKTSADAMGLELNRITLMIHTGSRGFGHQICDDYLKIMDKAVKKYGIVLSDRQLACAPLKSSEAQDYLGAMRCAANFAFANRQIIAHMAREVFKEVLGKKAGGIHLRTVYDLAHNIAKIEKQKIDTVEKMLCVHRKGATKAFGPGHPELPDVYKEIGQPVLIPGDMGRYSYVLVGTKQAMEETFGSACHGAGRVMSRHQATKSGRGRDIINELREKGITVRARSKGTLAEEMSEAYKDVSEVVTTCVQAGLTQKVAKIKPLACIKG